MSVVLVLLVGRTYSTLSLASAGEVTDMNQSLNSWRWRSEIAFARTLLLLYGGPGSFALSPHLHDFFFDRYLRLAHYHRQRGNTARAERLFAQAHKHWIAIDPDDPPPAVAAVMPVPLPPIFTWAVALPREPEHERKVA